MLCFAHCASRKSEHYRMWLSLKISGSLFHTVRLDPRSLSHVRLSPLRWCRRSQRGPVRWRRGLGSHWTPRRSAEDQKTHTLTLMLALTDLLSFWILLQTFWRYSHGFRADGKRSLRPPESRLFMTKWVRMASRKIISWLFSSLLFWSEFTQCFWKASCRKETLRLAAYMM